MTDLKGTLYGIARAIVDNPDEVSIVENENGKEVKFILSVAESDMGKVIGKNGKNAKAIRTVMKAVAASEGKRVIVDIR